MGPLRIRLKKGRGGLFSKLSYMSQIWLILGMTTEVGA